MHACMHNITQLPLYLIYHILTQSIQSFICLQVTIVAIMTSFGLTICALSMVLGDPAASFILPNVTGQQCQWVMVGYLNMTDPTQQCPYPWQNVTSPVASCEKSASVLCDSVSISTSGANYQMVCGRFLGYQVGTPDGFASCCGRLETHYVDGISITYGPPGRRQHVYTYACRWVE